MNYRYLILLGRTIVGQAGTLDEAHQAIIRRHKRNGFMSKFDVVDTWNEPGRVIDIADRSEGYSTPYYVWDAA